MGSAPKKKSSFNYDYDALAVGVAVIDSKSSKILHANAELEAISLYSKDQLQDMPFTELFFKKSREEVCQFLTLEPIRSEMIVTGSEFLLQRRSKSQINVALSMRHVHDDKVKIITIINNEPRKELERELEQAYSQMIQTSKFISLAEMAAGIAHEINNPLAIVHSYAEQLGLLASKGKLTDKRAQEFSRKIMTATMRASEIITSLKKLSRSDDHEGFFDVPVENIIGEIVDLCKERFASHDVEIKSKIYGENLSVVCNSSQILQVFLNLMENALHVVKEEKERWVKIEVRLVDGVVQFSIEDSGPGIPPEIRTEIMNPFFTTKGVGEGTGLGLSISRSIIEKHKGRLVLDDDSKGAKFLFNLPLSSKSDEESSASRAKNQFYNLIVEKRDATPSELSSSQLALNPSDYTVLVVDDEVDLADGTRFGLESRGFNVEVAHNGEEALEILSRRPVDAILSDIRMPVVGGIELVHQILQIKRKLPKIFFITGSTNIPVDKYFALGVEGFFYKPVSIFQVIETLTDSLLPEQKYLSRKRPRIYFKKSFEVSASSKVQKKSEQVFNLGRGGMFLREDGDLPMVNDVIQFKLKFQDETGQKEVSGTATVRWVRQIGRDQRPRGFGVEFYSFEEEGAEALFEFLAALQVQAFIPEK